VNKIIISDTSCLIALSNIGQLSILKDLFKEIIITEEVKDEFGDKLPIWIKIKILPPNSVDFFRVSISQDILMV
jgi:predicted nucleic acid-binding protein